MAGARGSTERFLAGLVSSIALSSVVRPPLNLLFLDIECELAIMGSQRQKWVERFLKELAVERGLRIFVVAPRQMFKRGIAQKINMKGPPLPIMILPKRKKTHYLQPGPISSTQCCMKPSLDTMPKWMAIPGSEITCKNCLAMESNLRNEGLDGIDRRCNKRKEGEA